MILLHFALLLVADAAAATPTAAGDATQPKKPKLICKSIPVSGSRLGGKRVCASAQAWATNERGSRDLTQEIQDTNLKCRSTTADRAVDPGAY